MSTAAGAELVELFRQGLAWSKLGPGETVLLYADSNLPWPEYVPAAREAVQRLGAVGRVLIGPDRAITSADAAILDAWTGANLAVQLARPGIPIHSREHFAVLQSGTRILGIRQRIETMRALFPTPSMVERCNAGGRRLARASEIRVTSAAGTDLVMRKDGRKAHVQVGVADAPGMWDDLGSAQVATSPLEGSVDGTYVIAPGDVLMTLRKHVQMPIRLTFHEGLVTDIRGGADADLLRTHLARGTDHSAYRVAHAGWGMHPAADWSNPWGQDVESLYGAITASLGTNIFDTPHQFRGFGGANDCGIHLDICCRNASFFLDGEPIVVEGAIVAPELGATERSQAD